MALTASAVDHIETEVRAELRRRSLNPTVDTGTVRDLVSHVVEQYQGRVSDTSLPGLVDEASAVQQVHDRVVGYGPLQPYFDDSSVEEIWINEPGRVFIARDGVSELTTTVLTPEAVRDLVERMLRHSGRRVDLLSPFVDAVLPDGSRLHVAIPDITREHWAVNVRKFVVRSTDLADLVALGSLTSEAAQFLAAAVAAGLTVVVSGGTGAGKTTLLNCLASAIPARERVVVCEEVFELRPRLPDTVSMQTRAPGLDGTGEVTLRRLVREALRMRPSRIIVGEVRMAECLDMLIALNSGVPGLASVHANSAREALVKICTLPLLAGGNVTSEFVAPTVAATVDLVVHCQTAADGRRQVTEIIGVTGRVEGSVIETSEIFTSMDGELMRRSGPVPRQERFECRGIRVPNPRRPNSDVGSAVDAAGVLSRLGVEP